jgi:hypothetical protein
LAGQRLLLLGFDPEDAHLHQLGGFDCQVGALCIEPGGARPPSFVAPKHHEAHFAALAKRRLRRGVFRSIVDLQAAIHRYIAEHNAEPKPFVWTADPERILAAINRGKQALEALG